MFEVEIPHLVELLHEYVNLQLHAQEAVLKQMSGVLINTLVPPWLLVMSLLVPPLLLVMAQLVNFAKSLVGVIGTGILFIPGKYVRC